MFREIECDDSESKIFPNMLTNTSVHIEEEVGNGE